MYNDLFRYNCCISATFIPHESSSSLEVLPEEYIDAERMATQIAIQFGKKVRALRRQRGWRQIDLAAHANLSETYICELEKGKWEIGISTLERLAAALGVEISELFRTMGH